MPYLGNNPATQFAELKYQDFTGGTGTSFTLNDPVGSAQELEVFVNNVRQEPGVAYTVSGTTLTMTGSIVATDDFYVVFQGKSTGTATHPAGQALTATDGTFTGNLDVSSGTIKLDGNYPTNTGNVALGNTALDSLGTGNYNTAVGHNALTANTDGSNTALGAFSLATVTTGGNNVAVGREALEDNTGDNNTAVGYKALTANTSGARNTAVGRDAGAAATTGTNNTFIGDSSGNAITTGSKNTIVGRYGGNQLGLDIRTSDNNIVLSDGDGNPRYQYTNAHEFKFISPKDGGSAASTFMFLCEGSNPQGLRVQFTNASDDDNNEDFFRCIDSATTRCIITNQGDLQNHDNAYGATSDQKLKEQIIDASSQWDDIKALTVRKYKMKLDVTEKGDSDALWRLGVVAQEVETAGMSGLITENIDRDDDGNDLGTRTKVVKYSILYMKAIKALQEAMTRIETLETENNTQATQIADLITRVTALEDA